MALPPNIRINTQFPFPALVTGSAPIVISKANGIWRVSFSIANLGTQVPLITAYPTDYVLIWDSIANTFFRVTLSSFGLGGARTQRSVTASPIVVAAGDQILNVNIAAGAPTCALPAAATRNGVPLTFKDVGGQFFAHNLTITPNGAETIDGLANLVMKTNRQGVTLWPFNDGANSGWFLL